MEIFVSNPVVNLQDKFVVSFDVAFTGNSEYIAIGAEQTKRRASTISAISSFIGKILQGVIVDNGSIELPDYTREGDFIYSTTSSTNLFGHELVVYNDNVYELVVDPKSFDLNSNLNVYVHDKKLYQLIDGKYTCRDGRIMRNIANFPLTTISSYEGGKIKKSYYFDGDDSLINFQGKLRFIVSHSGKSIDIAKQESNGFDKLATFFFNGKVDASYIYLCYNGVEPKNVAISYEDVVSSLD